MATAREVFYDQASGMRYFDSLNWRNARGEIIGRPVLGPVSFREPTLEERWAEAEWDAHRESERQWWEGHH